MATIERTMEATMDIEATMEPTICHTCGDIGFTVALIYCDKCQFYAVHRYCLDTLPATFEEYVTWFCVDCEPKNAQLSTFDCIISLSAHESCPDEVETIEVIQSRLKERKTVKKKKKKVNKERKQEASYSLTEAGVLSPESNRPSELIELNCEDSHQIVEKILDKESSEYDQTKTSLVSADNLNIAKQDHVICEESGPHVCSSEEKVKLKISGDDMRLNEVKSDTEVKSLKKKQKKKKSVPSLNKIESCTPSSTPTEREVPCEKINEKVKMGQCSENFTEKADIPELDCGDAQLDRGNPDEAAKSKKKTKKKYITENLTEKAESSKFDHLDIPDHSDIQKLNSGDAQLDRGNPDEAAKSKKKTKKTKKKHISKNLTEKAESAKLEDGHSDIPDHSDIPELDCRDAQLDSDNLDEAAKPKKKTKKKKHISDSLAKHTFQSSPPIEPLELRSRENHKTGRGKERLSDKTKTCVHEKAVESETSIALANDHSNIPELDCRDGVFDGSISKEVEYSKKKKRKRETHTEVHMLESSLPLDGVNNNQEVESNNRNKKRKKITPLVANHDRDQSKEKSFKKPKHASIKTNVEQTDSLPVDGGNNNQQVESNNMDTKRKKITPLVAKSDVLRLESSPPIELETNCGDNHECMEKSIKKPKHASNETTKDPTDSSPVDGGNNNQQVESNNTDTKSKKITPVSSKSDARKHESRPPIELKMNCGENHDRDQCKEKSIKKLKHASIKTTVDPTITPSVDGVNKNQQVESNDTDTKRKKITPVLGKSVDGVNKNQQVESNDTDTKRKKITPVLGKSDARKNEISPPIELQMNCGEDHDRDQYKEKSIKKPKHANIKTTVNPTVSPTVDGGNSNQHVESNNMGTKRKKTTPLVVKSDVRKLESSPPIEFEMNCGENHDRDQCKATSIKKPKYARSKTAMDPTDDLSEIPKLNSSLQERRGLDVARCDEEVNNKNSKVVSNHDLITPELYVPAQPIIEPVWRGCFDLHRQNFGSVGLVAHLSSLACQRVWETAKLLCASLRPELLLRSHIWPKGFEKSGPNDDSIALYFFPDSRREEIFFDTLMDEMIRKDLAMTAKIANVELLVFTSVQLPVQFQRFQSRFYLWGVFRGKQAPLQIEGVVSGEAKTNSKSSVLKSKTPVSSLKNCGNYRSGSKRRPIHS